MAVDIVLNINSGLPDPRWALAAKYAATVLALLSHSAAAPSISAQRPENLGYRGFTIEDSNHGPFDHATICKGLLFVDHRPYAKHIGPKLERSLVKHLPPDVAATYGSYLQTEIGGP